MVLEQCDDWKPPEQDRTRRVAHAPTNGCSDEHQVSDQELEELDIAEPEFGGHDERADRDASEGHVFSARRALSEEGVREEHCEQGVAVRPEDGIRRGRALKAVEVGARARYCSD